MPALSEYKPATKIFALHISASGSGKTSAAATYPGPYHELDLDLRIAGLIDSVQQGFVDGSKITYQQFSPLDGWEPIGKHLENLNNTRIAMKSGHAKWEYGTIGLGSIGSLERFILSMARRELKTGHVVVGGLTLGAPGDWRVSNIGINQVLDYLQAFPCNVVCTAHLIPKWGKPEPPDDLTDSELKQLAYKPNEVIGETLNFNDSTAESVISRFDNVFKFERKLVKDKMKYTVEFAGELTKNAFGIGPGKHDITGKNFYAYLQELIAKKGATK